MLFRAMFFAIVVGAGGGMAACVWGGWFPAGGLIPNSLERVTFAAAAAAAAADCGLVGAAAGGRDADGCLAAGPPAGFYLIC